MSTLAAQWQPVTASKAPRNLGDVACLIVPALAFLRVDLGGVVFATDICLLVLLLLLVAKRHGMFQERTVQIVCLLGLAWLAAQVLSDLLQGTPSAQYVRGWGKISLTVAHLMTLALLIRRSWKRLVLYGVGLAFGALLTFFLTPGEYALSTPWKFGLGIPVTVLVCVLAGGLMKRSKVAALLMILLVGCLNLYLGFRSLGGICFAVVVFTQGRLMFRTSKARAMILGSIATLFGAWATSAAYSYAATGGWLGELARQTYIYQSSGEGGILVGGRSDIIGAAAAIVDSPFIGHGSWARDPKYAALQVELMAAMGYRSHWNLDDPDLIPSHSHLLGAWVEAGVVGAAFWTWVLWLTVKALARASGIEPLFPFLVFIAFLLIWNIFLSPYGAEMRFLETYSIYAMVMLNHASKSRVSRYAYVQGIHRNYLFEPRGVRRASDPVGSGAGGS
jgi:hypothetical protein